MRGRFIVFEGMDGSGKSTHARLLGKRLDAVVTREPGSGSIGPKIRELLLSTDTVGLSDRSEALLMAADRAQHVAEIVRPALEAGRHVVSDRYLYSSVAYQGHGRGLDPAEIRRLSLWATDDLQPDLVVFLDVPDDTSEERLSSDRDRLESVGAEFRARVSAGYRAQIDDRWIVVDAQSTVRATADAVWNGVVERLGDVSAPAPGGGHE